MRQVIANIWNEETKGWDAISGFFHCWGYDIAETMESISQFSVAIIEMENGKVMTAKPGNVTFTN